MSEKNPYKKGGMFEGASFLLFENAKKLRNIVRFTNDQVSKQIETVLNKISEIVNIIIKNKASKIEV